VTILNKRVNKIESDIGKIEKRFMYDGLEPELYHREKRTLESEITNIKEEKEKLGKKISNLDKKIDSCVEFSQNISKNWSSGSIDSKQQIQKLMFPKGIIINPKNRQYRTGSIPKVVE
jgi:predicted  nucleic acid-binding Zn-ribbon protein